MLTLNLRLGIAELALAASLVFIGALVVLFVVEWPVGLVPAASYAIASAGAYAGYRVHQRERAAAAVREEAADRKVTVKFRVVDTRGACPLGRRTGDVIAVGEDGAVSPFVCPEAAAVLQIAARDGQNVEQWCCPVYDHMLVMRREAVAA